MHHLIYCWFVLALLLAGCVPKPDGITRIQYSFWGSIEQQAVEREVVAAFEKENPDIKVELMPIGARYSEKIQAMMVGKVAPDVLMTEITQYLEWAARGALLDLTDEVNSLTNENPLMPVPKHSFQRDGKFMAFPINCSGQAMFYNIDALTAAGIDPSEFKTWDDVLRLAPRLSKRGGNPNAPTDYALLMPSPLMLFWAYGGELFDSAEHPSKVTANSPEGIAGIEFLRKLHASGCAVPPDVSSDQGTYELFRDGRVALHFDGRWRTPNFAGKTNFDWNVRVIPSGPKSHATLHGGTGLAISSNSKNIEAAKRFIRFYVSRAGVEITIKGGRYVPVYREMAFSDKFLSLRPPTNIRVFSETMEKGASRFILYAPGATQVTTIFSSRMEQATSEPNRPAKEILAGLEIELTRWLKNQKRKGML